MSQFIEMFGNQDVNDRSWNESIVKDEFTLTMGKTPARNNPAFWQSGTNKWISISDMARYGRYTEDTQESITDIAVAESGIKIVPKGTIIMSFKLSIGRTAVTSEDIYTNEAIMAFRDVDETKFNMTFLQFLIANKNWLLNAKQAVKGQTLNKESIGNARIIVPPIGLQEQFAAIYNQADKSGFDGFKSQFIEMFKCSAEGVALSSLCDTFIDGDWIEAKDQSDSGIRLIQTGNVGVGTFKDKGDKARYISEDTFNRLNCTEVVEGDILISRLPDPVGRACIIPAGLGKSITAVDCTIIRLNNKVLPKFFVAFTSTPDYAMQIKKVLSGTTRLRVSRANLGKIQVPLPSVDKQQQFVTIAEQADKSGSVGLKSGLNFAKLLIHR